MILTRPEWVLSAPLVAALLTIALLAQRRRLQRLARSYTDEATRRLVPLDPGRFPTIRMACLLLASLAIGLAAAGPAPVAREPAEPPAPLDLAIAVDVSLSMTAPDVEPTRLGRAREIVAAVSEAIPSARVTLVVFADWPYTLVPPTDDPAVVQHFARSLAPDVVLERDQGTSLAGALLTARRALDARPRSRARRVVLVLSDGGAHDGIATTLEAVVAASDGGVQVWTGGLGTSQGASLGTPDGPILDPRGAPVVATLDEGLLRAVADAGGGRYIPVGDDRGVRSLVAALEGGAGSSVEPAARRTDAALWLTLLAIPLLLWEGALDSGRGPKLRPKYRPPGSGPGERPSRARGRDA